MICNYCLCEFEPKHFNQRLCSPECKQAAIRRAKNKYKTTDKGIQSNQRWINSDRRKENEKRYTQNPKRRKQLVAAQNRYLSIHPEAQEKKRERDQKFGKTQHGREINKASAARYRLSEQGRFVRRINKARRRGAIGIFSKSEWEDKLNENGNKCVRCGSSDHLEIDHIRPIALGGTNTIDNVQPLCRSCNASKGARYVG